MPRAPSGWAPRNGSDTEGQRMPEENPPRVTVMTCVYNGEAYLAAAIQSILDQTYTDYEYLILDDGSTDRSPAIIESFDDPRIRFIRNPGNLGVQESENRCLEMARGTYLAVQDADDLAHPDRLSRQVMMLDENPDIGAVGTWFEVIDENGKPIQNRHHPVQAPATDPIALKWLMLTHCELPHCTAMYRTDLARAVGGYGPYAFGEDYDLLSRLSAQSGLRVIPECLQSYRQNPQGFTATRPAAVRIRCCMEITRQNIERILGEPLSWEVTEQLRLYPVVTEGKLQLHDPPPATPQTIAETLDCYMRLYRKFSQTIPLSLTAKRLIANDLIRQTARLLVKLSYPRRLATLWRVRRQLPAFLWTSPLFWALLPLSQGMLHGGIAKLLDNRSSWTQCLGYQRLFQEPRR